ncbi:SLATT domain-containing protein [Rhizobium ruizarguesonis]|uniref:SLATT domain-containing protein n=1 Tax=Rhizobium leguminosarum TaxID=384 RepID=UPI001C9299CE|nr:SLATT domain-containing protein [Rhizobium leguminosarum]MBY3043179.1 SLATT domain-containing protein [Rhizobium leguminosarum]
MMSDKVNELLGNMKSTAASRYNAAKRLEAKERSLTRLTAFTSAYVVGLTVVPYFVHLLPGSADRMNLLTFVLGTAILVASLIQYSARDGVNAELHYRCGLEIGEMRRRLKILGDTIDQDMLLKISNEYSLILSKYSINHDQVDFDQYRIERSEEAKKLGYFERWIAIPFRMHLARHAANIALIAITILMGWLIWAVIAPAWHLAAPATGP